MLGCLCAKLFVQMKDRIVTPLESRIACWSMTAAILATFVGCWAYYRLLVDLPNLLSLDSSPETLLVASIWMAFSSCFGFAPLIGAIVFCSARYRNPIVSFLSSPLIVLCGEASYSLYLLHMTVIYAFRFSVSPIVSTGVAYANAMMWVVTMLSAIGLSLVTWRIIEVPSRRWLRRLLMSSARPTRSPQAQAWPISPVAGAAVLVADVNQQLGHERDAAAR
jgi:hypothetical protein